MKIKQKQQMNFGNKRIVNRANNRPITNRGATKRPLRFFKTTRGDYATEATSERDKLVAAQMETYVKRMPNAAQKKQRARERERERDK